MFRTERRKQPPAGSDQKFADQKRKVSKRAIGSFLTRRCDRRRVFIDARRIESFANGKDRQVDRRHDVVGMNRAGELQINVAERVSERAVCRWDEPIRRQSHDENSHRANDAADNDYAIRRKALSESTDYRSEDNDEE